MSITTRPARCADHDPGKNFQFDRGWIEPVVTGADVPDEPAHPYSWHAGEMAEAFTAAQRGEPAWRRAEAAWRAFAGSRGSVYRRGGK